MRLGEQIKAEFRKAREAEKERNRRISELVPAGSSVWYRHGDNEVPVEVITTGSDRLYVRSGVSGKQYWISAYAVI
jgi:hypothetical protein